MAWWPFAGEVRTRNGKGREAGEHDDGLDGRRRDGQPGGHSEVIRLLGGYEDVLSRVFLLFRDGGSFG